MGSMCSGIRVFSLTKRYPVGDGHALWTETGHAVDAPSYFLSCLPPAIAIVGELFFGYGHKEFRFATTVAQNKLPSTMVMAPGAHAGGRGRVWQHARIVGFDVPSFGYLPYALRHQLLWQITGSWGRYLNAIQRIPYGAQPLMAIVQYNLGDLPNLFREVVHGVSHGVYFSGNASRGHGWNACIYRLECPSAMQYPTWWM